MGVVRFENVSKTYGDGNLAVDDLSLEIADGEFMVFVGPSGCGKTTALRMVAGLEEITGGQILLDGQSLNDIHPSKRDIAMVFQNYALYPHMNVFENIAFPLRSRGVPRGEIQARVTRTAQMLGLDTMLKRKPRTLSGGQRQRVAMGRAVVREPQVFLMDEPLSNLDAKLRAQMRAEIARLHADLGVTTLYVTHDQVEAMTMGTRIAAMRKGVLQQLGRPQELFDEPANLFVASFMGSPPMNLLKAKVQQADDGLRLDLGDQTMALPEQAGRHIQALRGYVGTDIALGIRPEHLVDAAQTGQWPNMHAEVRVVETLGSEQLVHMEITGEPVLTDEVVELAQDTDATTVESLQTDGQARRVPLVARVSTTFTATPQTNVTIAAAPESMRFFDLNTGKSI